MSTELVHLDEARRELAAATTPERALGLANYATAWQAAVKAANYSFEVQQQAAELRLRAERRLGQLLADTVQPGSRHTPDAQIPDGITRQRSSRAQKLARISDDDFEVFLTNTVAAEREVTLAAALKLLPVTPKPNRSSVAHVYTVPPIDLELARREGLDASDERAELLVHTIQLALEELAESNPQHAYVWAKHQGIEDNGTLGDSWTFAAIAARLGVSREVVAERYYRASTFIYQRTTVAAFNLAAQLMAAR